MFLDSSALPRNPYYTKLNDKIIGLTSNNYNKLLQQATYGTVPSKDTEKEVCVNLVIRTVEQKVCKFEGDVISLTFPIVYDDYSGMESGFLIILHNIKLKVLSMFSNLEPDEAMNTSLMPTGAYLHEDKIYFTFQLILVTEIETLLSKLQPHELISKEDCLKLRDVHSQWVSTTI